MSDDRTLLLDIVREAYDGKAWHGPNLRAVLRGVNANQAFWRPTPERHSAWELMLHCAYWKFAAWRRLTGARGVKFPRAGKNFIAMPEPTERAWREDLQLLADSHGMLLDAIAELPKKTLASRARMVYGVAMHDTYHAGQIRLMMRLYGA
jgi:hypothetical protein